MDDRPLATKLTAGLTLMALGLAGCGAPAPVVNDPIPATANVTPASAARAEAALRRQAAALQRTILEGAIVGAAVGGGLGLVFGDDDDARRGLQLGLLAGATAGTYVAFVQRRYLTRGQRLKQIKADLDRNAAEMRTTIQVMRDVLALQRQELADVKARLAAGTASNADLQAELAQARANLGEMQKAIAGATARQSELGATRGLTRIRNGASPIDADLATLAAQIDAMKQIANDLSSQL